MKPIKETNLERALITNDSEFKVFFDSVGIDNRRFVQGKIARYPRKIQRIIIGRYSKEATPFLANTWLRELTEILDPIIPPYFTELFRCN